MNGIDINTKINVGSENVIMDGEHISFQKKNTLAYKQLLSNYHKNDYTGYPSTTGKNISIQEKSKDPVMLYTSNDKNFYLVTDNMSYSGDTFTDNDTSYEYDISTVFDSSVKVTIGDSTYSIPNSSVLTVNKKLTLPVKGEIKSMTFDGTNYMYVVKSGDDLYKCSYDGSIWSSAIITNAKEAYFAKNNSTLIYSDLNYTFIEGGTQILDFPTTNGYYTDSNNFILGYENDNHYLCRTYAKISGTLTTHLYHGLVSSDGTVYGEPYPVDSSNVPLTFEYEENGAMKWTLDSTATSSITVAEPTELISSDTGANANTMTINKDASYKWCYGWKPLEGTFLTLAGTTMEGGVNLFPYTGSNYYITNAVSRTIIGTNEGLGSLNGTATTYTNLYPLKYAFTNIISDRGSKYDYGDGWYKIKYSTFVFGTAKCAASTYPVVLETPAKYIQNGKTYYLDAVGSAITSYSTAPSGTWSFGIALPAATGATQMIADETDFIYDSATQEYYRHHVITSDEIKNNTWLDFIHSMDFDVSAIGFYIDKGTYKLHFYNDSLIGASSENTAVSPVSTEWSGLYYCDSNNLMLDNFVYKIEITGKLKITKIADYLFSINIITPNNIFSENKNGEIENIRGFIPYNNEMSISTTWQNMKMLLAEDGEAYNDVWFEAAGVNVSLNDKYPYTSSLLPAMEVNMYLNTDNLAEFNRNTIDGAEPLFVPETGMLSSEDELQVFYTHTQATTDNTYKYSIINGIKSSNSKYTDTTWYASTDLIILCLGLGSLYSNINYISSTLVLPGDYSARLYTSNNTAYLCYNAATQVYHSSSVFTIYSSSYYYDGQAIYYTGNLNTTTSNEFVCYALGMTFLANSGTEAYFYSDFDKSIYTFTGSNTLTKTTSIAMFGEPVSSLFSSCNQSLYLLNSSGDLFVLSNESSCVITGTGATSLQGVSIGCACCDIDDTAWTVYDPKDGGTLLPLNLQTNWIGDDSKVFTFSFADIVLFNENPTSDVKVKFYIITQNGIATSPYEKIITIKPSEWKGNNYRIRTNPANETGTAFKLGIYSESDIHVQTILVEIKTSSTQNNTAKGWN